MTRTYYILTYQPRTYIHTHIFVWNAVKVSNTTDFKIKPRQAFMCSGICTGKPVWMLCQWHYPVWTKPVHTKTTHLLHLHNSRSYFSCPCKYYLILVICRIIYSWLSLVLPARTNFFYKPHLNQINSKILTFWFFTKCHDFFRPWWPPCSTKVKVNGV